MLCVTTEPITHESVQLQHLDKDDGVSPQRESGWLSKSLCPALSPSVLFTSAQLSNKYCQVTSRVQLVCCIFNIYTKWIFVHSKEMHRTGMIVHFLFKVHLFKDCILGCVKRSYSLGLCTHFSGNLWVTFSLWQLLKLGENHSVLTTKPPLWLLIFWANVTH